MSRKKKFKTTLGKSRFLVSGVKFSASHLLIAGILLTVVSVAAWYYLSFLRHTRDSGSLYRMIDHVDSNSGIQSGADSLLSNIYKRQASINVEDDFVKVSVVKLYGRKFLNLVSLKTNWRGNLYSEHESLFLDRINELKEMQFDLYVKFEKTEAFKTDQILMDLYKESLGPNSKD